jgi:hypothetical protein
MRKGGVRLQICTTNHLKIQILLEREKFNMEINILWLEVRLKMSDLLRISKLYTKYRYPNWQLSNQVKLYFDYCKIIFVQRHLG